MWYDLDVKRLGRWLLPPILRGRVLIAVLNVLLHPIGKVYDSFTSYRKSVDRRMKVTCHVQDLERVLTDMFFLDPDVIRITTTSMPTGTYLYRQMEGLQPVYVHGSKSASVFHLRERNGTPPGATFVVHIPTFLCTSLNTEEDKYKGVHLILIHKVLDYYKPAGRSYRIELFDYYG